MNKKVYVIGHRNPDTDSIVSAAAYAALKRAQGNKNCFALRAGKLSPQTEYIFNRFHVPVPEYMPDLIPKAGHYITSSPPVVQSNVTIWEALERMQGENLRAAPVVDENGVYQGMLNYSIFAKYIITTINPNKKASFPVSISHLVNTLRAQTINIFDGESIRKSNILVAASYGRYFRARLENSAIESALVIMGDRWDLQEFCIEKKVRALILSGGNTLAPGLFEKARESGVSVISSPYDTSFTSMLVMYSTPVSEICDSSIPLVQETDAIKKIRAPLARAPSRCLPVGNDRNQVTGVIFEGDLIEEPNVEVIMVDHNEPSQAIEGIENYKILEVIDHHRLGNLSTKYPINFINKVVGATCTIIANLYREQMVPMEKETASILLCGVLADTIGLQSATTTAVDVEAAEYLSSITGLDVERLALDMQEAANLSCALSAPELIALDMKAYNEAEGGYTVSQVETTSPQSLVARREEMLAALERVVEEDGRIFAAMLVTDVTRLDSLLFITGKKDFISKLAFPRIEDGVFLLKDIVSRKKQLVPLLSELVQEFGR
ncbi:MAG: putative manganese-dependent inorganic diphosphatase [Spirochaetaceae bacterium]|jgi:manganese-dependent inorganic pyrophosphatase|nr:putative manganese-dependent inorganic diphosphatase [Spirochaetaceae bacterium]